VGGVWSEGCTSEKRSMLYYICFDIKTKKSQARERERKRRRIEQQVASICSAVKSTNNSKRKCSEIIKMLSLKK